MKVGDLVKFLDCHGEPRVATIVGLGPVEACQEYLEILCDGWKVLWPSRELEVVE